MKGGVTSSFSFLALTAMKRITTFCLVVGLMIACTENESVKKDASQNIPSILYKGKLYDSDDERLGDYIMSSSISLQFDFEDYMRLLIPRRTSRNFFGILIQASISGLFRNCCIL
jgi:hypothetical protein